GRGDRLVETGADRIEHARIAECGRVAPLLQLETAHVDAARRIHREDEREIDLRLGAGAGRGEGPQDRECRAEPPGATIPPPAHPSSPVRAGFSGAGDRPTVGAAPPVPPGSSATIGRACGCGYRNIAAPDGVPLGASGERACRAWRTAQREASDDGI